MAGSGFAIFYTGINVGALLAPLVCGSLQQHIGYDAGFSAAGVGMVIGLVTFLGGSPWLRRDDATDSEGCDTQESLLSYTSEQALHAPPTWDLRAMLSLMGLVGCVVPFWVPFEQLSNVVPLFFRERTQRSFLGFPLPAAWLQAVNPLVCVSVMPLLTSLWARQARRGAEPSATTKMAIGCGIQSFGWAVMAVGSVGASPEHPAPLLLPLIVCMLLSVAQLYLAPIGLALISKCCPTHARSTAVGFWFLAGGVGGILAGPVGALYSLISTPAFFALLATISAGASVLMICVAPRLQRMAMATAASANDKRLISV